MTSPPDCIFCKIVAGDAPAARIYEDEQILVFMDLFPVAHGHTLLIPKRHYPNLFEATEDTLPALILASRRVARALNGALAPDGIGVYQLNGAAAGQTVFHYHMHLIPRGHGDSLAIHGRKMAPMPDLEAVAAQIAAVLEEA